MDTLNGLDWGALLGRLEAFATSGLAQGELQNVSACESPAAALASVEKVLQYQRLLKFGSRPHMESLDLFSGWHTRLKKSATLTRLELKDVRHFCREALALAEYIRMADIQDILFDQPGLLNPEEPLSAIDQILTADGDIRGDASEKIFQLTQEKQQQTRQLQHTLDRLVKHHQMEPLLQDKYITTREGRWVLPIKSGMRHGLDGIIHSTSQSKQTVFMEPEVLIPLNNRLRQIEVEMEEEIDRLLTELSQYLHSVAPQFDVLKEGLLEADIYLAKAQLSEILQGQGFQFSHDEIRLEDLRHPILLLNKEAVVANTVHLNPSERILLLSGPNAGGKTVLLKSVGLAAQMARCGLPIAAKANSQIPFFKTILTAVGDQQNVDANLSTFAAHLKALDQATKIKGPESLVLLDEICGSTDPEEGAALARSFIETYLKNQIFAVITSHLGALKSGWENPGLIHGSLEFDKASGPTYSLLKGVAGQSLALFAARRAGVDETIVNRATELLSPELRRYQSALKEVEEMKAALHRIQNEVAQEKRALEAEKQKYETERQKFEKEKQKNLDKILREAEQKADKAIQEAQVKGLFHKHSEAEKIKFDLPHIVKASSPSDKPTAKKIESAAEFYEYHPAGSKVFVSSVGLDGIVQGSPNGKGEIPVLCQSMRVTVPWQQLRTAENPTDPTRQILRKKGHFAASVADEDRSLDLRGLKTDQALDRLEKALDQAVLAGEDRVRIVHGHGTDALKKALRSYLSRSLYVKKWVAGSKESGGDGVTWVELQD